MSCLSICFHIKKLITPHTLVTRKGKVVLFRSMNVSLNLQITIVYLASVKIAFCDGLLHMMWILHPEVENYYQYMRNQNVSFSSITTLTRIEKEEMCESRITVFTVGTEHLRAAQRHSQMLYPVLYPLTCDPFTTKYSENLPNELPDYIHLPVDTGSEVVMTEALPCVSYNSHTWYIINGYEPNLYFTSEMSEGGEKSMLTGLLEPYPEIYLYRGNGLQELEEKFLLGQRLVALTKRRLSLCRLNRFQKFRICSTIFVAWRNHLPYPAGPFYKMRDINGNRCLKHIFLSSENRENGELSRVPVDLLICPARENERLRFFVTADESGRDSVFGVIPRLENGRHKYFLSTYVTNVKALKNAINGDFMVETFIEDDALYYM